MAPPTNEWLRDVKRGDYYQSLKSFSKAIETLASTESDECDSNRTPVEPTNVESQAHMLRAIEQFCAFARRQLRIAVADQDANWDFLATVAAAHASVADDRASVRDHQRHDAGHLPMGASSPQSHVNRSAARKRRETALTSAGIFIDPEHTAVLGLWRLGYTSTEIAAVVGRASNDVAKLVEVLLTGPNSRSASLE